MWRLGLVACLEACIFPVLALAASETSFWYTASGQRMAKVETAGEYVWRFNYRSLGVKKQVDRLLEKIIKFSG